MDFCFSITYIHKKWKNIVPDSKKIQYSKKVFVHFAVKGTISKILLGMFGNVSFPARR